MSAVKSNAFMLSSATLMIAPAFSVDVFSLTPGAHGVGMSSDVAIKVDSSLLELKNGIAQTVVDARRTGVMASISANVFEFTAANIQRAAAIATGTVPTVKRGVLSSAAAGAATTISLTSDPVSGDAGSAITATGDIPVGSQILIQRVNGEQDYVFPTVSTGAATGAGPFAVPIAGVYAIPAAMSFAIGARVWVISNAITIADSTKDDLFGVKVTGTLSNFDRPVTAVFPKVRISKGFQMNFTEAGYQSMPFEMVPFVMSTAEATGRLLDIGVNAPGLVYMGA
jgi:hypothetical protein